jgi:hypothetical protein
MASTATVPRTEEIRLNPFDFFMQNYAPHYSPAMDYSDWKYWTKKVTGYDPVLKGAYRLEGSWRRKGEQTYRTDEIYVFCDGNPEWKLKRFYLFIIKPNDAMDGPGVGLIQVAEGGRWIDDLEPQILTLLDLYGYNVETKILKTVKDPVPTPVVTPEKTIGSFTSREIVEELYARGEIKDVLKYVSDQDLAYEVGQRGLLEYVLALEFDSILNGKDPA